jgi:fibronectin-binding autotransporter adhesin
MVLMSQYSIAATYYWDPTGVGTPGTPGNPESGLSSTATVVTGTWGTTSNFWTTNPNSTLSTDYVSWTTANLDGNDAVLSAGVVNINSTISLNSNIAVNSLRFATRIGTFNGVGGTRTLTIGPGGLSLAKDSLGTQMTASVGGNIAFANTVAVVLSGSQTWLNNAFANQNQITFAGTVTAAAGAPVTLTLKGGPGGSGFQFSGVMADGASGGVLGVTLDTLAGNNITNQLNNVANTFTGQVQVLNGKLQFNSIANVGVASSLGAATGTNNAIILGNSAAANNVGLVYAGSAASVSNRDFAFVGTGGTVSLLNNSATTAPNTMTLSGAFNIAAGSKTLELGGSNPTGTNSITSDLGDPTGSGTLSIVKTGSSNWSLSGNNVFSGGLTINLGSVSLTSATAGGSGGITINTGGFLNINANGINNSIDLKGGTIVLNFNLGGSGVLNFYSGAISLGTGIGVPTNMVDKTGGLGAGVLAVSGVSDFNITDLSTNLPNANWFLGTANGATFTGATLAASSGTYQLGGGGGTLVVQNAVLTGTNSAVFGSTNGGNVVLNSGNTYSGLTFVQSGTVTVSSIGTSTSGSSGLGAGSLIGLGTGTESVTLQYTGAGETTDKSIFVIGTGANTVATISNKGTGQLIFSGPVQITGVESLGLGAASDTMGGSIGNITGGNIIKNGLTNSVWILTGTNSTSGKVTISGGVLQTSAGDIANSQLTIQGADNTHYAVWQTSGTVTKTLTLGGNAGFSAKGGILTVNMNNGADWNHPTGGPALVFGSLTADNEVIFQNNIIRGVTDAAASLPIYVESGLGGDYARITGNITNKGNGAATPVIGSSGLNKIGTGTLVLSGSNSYGISSGGATGATVGTTAVQAGTLLVDNNPAGVGSATGYGNITVAANTTFGGNGKVILGFSGTATVASDYASLTASAGSIISVNPAILGHQAGTGHLVIDMTGNTLGKATFGNNTVFNFTLDAANMDVDLLSFQGLSTANQVTFGTGININFSQIGTLAAGDYLLTLMDFSGLGGTYSKAGNFTFSGLSGYDSAVFDYSDPTKIQLHIISSIPEPSTVMLLVVGGAILAYAGYRRRQIVSLSK